MTDERLREAYRSALPTPFDRGDCPAPEALRVLVERLGPEGERLRTLDHVMACAACREEFDLLSAVAAARPAPRTWVPLAAAAAVVLLGGVGAWAALRPNVVPEPVRGPGAEVRLVTPPDTVMIAPPIFTWHALPDANRYHVEVLDPAGNVAWSGDTRDTVLMAQLDGVAPGVYRWWVTARAGDGAQATSALRPFRLRQAQ